MHKAPSARLCKLTLMLFIGAALICCSGKKQSPARAVAELSPAELEQQVGYPRASWRIDPSRTNHVRLGLAHILITHAQTVSTRLGAPFVGNQNQRSREQALRLSVEVAHTLQAQPERFAQLAAQHSDDRASFGRGGVLGIVAIAGLPPAMLDALSALKVGQISRVIETEYGFHIVKRLSVAQEQRIAARAILIQHREVPTERRGEKEITRTREQALELARGLHEQLLNQPEKFVDLARQHSDAVEGSSDGEIAVWSSYEGSERGMNAWFISQLEVGSISEVLEMPAGYQIYQRAALPRREPLVVRFLRIGPDTVGGDDAVPTPELSGQAQALATRIAADLAKHPSRFEAELNKYCPKHTDCSAQLWSLERGQNQLQHVQAVERVKIGQVVTVPIRVGPAFLILRREDPASLVESQQRYELEMPVVPFLSLEDRLQSLDGVALGRATLELLELAEGRLALTSAQRPEFRAMFTALANALRTAASEDRARLIAQHQIKVLALIGPEKMGLLHALREEQWRNAQLM